jgi:hypothetical protein
MTGGALDDSVRTLIVESASPLLQKPFDIEQILALVRARAGQASPFSSPSGSARL